MKEDVAVPADKTLFEQLVKQNMKRAYFTALGLTGSHDLAVEISQEAFLRAFRSFNRFDNTKNFFTWYYRILKNIYLNLTRDNKRKKEVRLFEIKSYALAGEITEDYEKQELSEKLEIAIMELDVEAREIIILRELEGLDYKEIAGMLDIPEGTVMSRLYYARKKLAAKLRSIYE